MHLKYDHVTLWLHNSVTLVIQFLTVSSVSYIQETTKQHVATYIIQVTGANYKYLLYIAMKVG